MHTTLLLAGLANSILRTEDAFEGVELCRAGVLISIDWPG